MSKELESLKHLIFDVPLDKKNIEELKTKASVIISNIIIKFEELEKRETPMKWIEVNDEHGSRDECPLCGYPSYNDLGHNHYCTVCGQRLGFEDEKDE